MRNQETALIGLALICATIIMTSFTSCVRHGFESEKEIAIECVKAGSTWHPGNTRNAGCHRRDSAAPTFEETQ